jgi:hypothetical protein
MARFLTLALICTACSADSIDFASMENAERVNNERQARELCAFMSIETMFPDEYARFLARAAASGGTAGIEKALESDAAADARGHRNCTVLFWALPNIVGFEALLERGADPNFVFDDGGSIMRWVSRSRDRRARLPWKYSREGCGGPRQV